MAAASRDYVNRGTSIKQHGFMAAAEVVKSQFLKPEPPRPADEFLAYVARAARLCEGKRLGENQGTLGQFNEPQVNRYAVRYAGNQPQNLFAL
jgi:hypothetical protein